jgi:hypothetical protein
MGGERGARGEDLRFDGVMARGGRETAPDIMVTASYTALFSAGCAHHQGEGRQTTEERPLQTQGTGLQTKVSMATHPAMPSTLPSVPGQGWEELRTVGTGPTIHPSRRLGFYPHSVWAGTLG